MAEHIPNLLDAEEVHARADLIRAYWHALVAANSLPAPANVGGHSATSDSAAVDASVAIEITASEAAL